METESTIRLYSLDYGRAKTYAAAGLCVAANVVVPQLCHLVPGGGAVLLPIYFFTLVAAVKYGWRAGLLTAVASPLVNALLFGMPGVAALPPILVKSVVLALVAGYAAQRLRSVSIPMLAGVGLAYQFAGTLFEWAFTGSFHAAVQDFRMGIPGMLLQVAGGWAVLRYLLRK